MFRQVYMHSRSHSQSRGCFRRGESTGKDYRRSRHDSRSRRGHYFETRVCDHVIGQILADVDRHLVRRLVQGAGTGTVAGDLVRPLRIRYPVQVPSRVIVGGGVEGAGIPAIRCPVKAKVMGERNKSRREVQGQGWR